MLSEMCKGLQHRVSAWYTLGWELMGVGEEKDMRCVESRYSCLARELI